MSLNKYMHPRNIYKTPPNFKQLAIHFPEFRKYVKQDISGKVTLDFKDINALHALSCTLLKKDFKLEVKIPLNKMIPTIPLRLNYILWVEDLLSISEKVTEVHGIDIGTGASCVYPLISARKNCWRMLATEVDAESFQTAKENVERNLLSDYITVKMVGSGALLKEVLSENSQIYDFCMCNPPFFASTQELNPSFKSRKLDRPHPRNAFCTSLTEAVTNGGEVEFVGKLISESKELNKTIRIFTTMLGHKSSLPPLKKLLRETEVKCFKETEFCQGHTTRWGLAWTFYDYDLRKIPESTVKAAKKINEKPLEYVITQEVSLQKITEMLMEIFNRLQMNYEEIKKSKNVVAYNITAHSNTWSHQRKKRREQAKLTTVLNRTPERNETPTSELKETCDMISDLEMDCSSPKRPIENEEDDDLHNSKKTKTDSLNSSSEGDFYLESLVIIRKESTQTVVELSLIETTAQKDCLHQIMQYLKNNLKF